MTRVVPQTGPRMRWCGVQLALVALVLLPAGAGAQDLDPDAWLERAADRYLGAQALCADFRQTIHVALLRRTVESEGRICQQRPNLFSMRFTDPAGDVVISDGEHFWIYYPSVDARQVVRRSVRDAAGRHDLLREFLDDSGAKYQARDAGADGVDGHPCRILVLSPRSPDAGGPYRQARVWLDVETYLMRRLELHEENGNVRTLTFGDMDLSPTLEPGLFTFAVPENARVRGFGGGMPRALP